MKLNNIKLTFTVKQMLLEAENSNYNFKLEAISQKLLYATPSERENVEISPSGYGIYWPLLDEDLSIKGLVKTYNAINHLEEIN